MKSGETWKHNDIEQYVTLIEYEGDDRWFVDIRTYKDNGIYHDQKVSGFPARAIYYSHHKVSDK